MTLTVFDRGTILIIEDDQDLRESMKDALELEGYKVQTAANGKEGLSAIKNIPKTCLIMVDMLMPIMGGREFIDTLKQDLELAQVPILVVSSVATKENTNGAIGFIKKPADLNTILQMIQTYCQ